MDEPTTLPFTTMAAICSHSDHIPAMVKDWVVSSKAGQLHEYSRRGLVQRRPTSRRDRRHPADRARSELEPGRNGGSHHLIRAARDPGWLTM